MIYDEIIKAQNVLTKIDRRLITNNYIEFANVAKIPQSIEEHKELCQKVKDRILLSAGLLPFTKLDKANAKITCIQEFRDILIKGVLIEPIKGLKLTGSLFMPQKFDAPLPGILCPHGHWTNGRVHDEPSGGVVKRCCELARLGFVVFAYDMIGYNDCNDLPHRWSEEFKLDAELYGISTFGLQTANSIAACNYLCSLNEVDASNIGCTGASGGATQTWIISALDERIKAIAPVCMLSSHFQGGCACEEGPLLRTCNLTTFDIVAALAPRAIILPSVTGDWTNHNPEYEIPKLKEVYQLYDASNKVDSFHYHDGHNYNKRTREHIYAWFVKQLKNEVCGDIIEEENYNVPDPKLLYLTGKEPKKPTKKSANKALKSLKKAYALDVSTIDKKSLTSWQNTTLDILSKMLENTEGEIKDVVDRAGYQWEIPGGKATNHFVSRRLVGDFIPTIEVTPTKVDNPKEVILYVASNSYKSHFSKKDVSPVIKSALKNHKALRFMELLGSNCFASQLKHAIRNPYQSSSAFDQSYFSMRVHDVMTLIARLKEENYTDIRIVAELSAVPVALAAAALTQTAITVDLAKVTNKTWTTKVNYQPLIMNIGGLAGLLALNVNKNNTFVNCGKYKKLLEDFKANIKDGKLKNFL